MNILAIKKIWHFTYKFSHLLKLMMFASIVLTMSFIFGDPCYAKSNISVGKSEIYDPVWTIDSDFWNFSSIKTLSSEGIIDAAYSPVLKQWVCLLSAGDILVSNDLKQWKRYNMGNHYEMESIIWADDKYIACGQILLYSMDGIKWYDANIELSYQNSANYGRGTEYEVIGNAYWNGSQYLAYGCNMIKPLLYMSNDGINWRLPEHEEEYYTIGWGFCWNGSTWLAVGNEKATLCNYDGKWRELNIASLTSPDTSQELVLEDCVWTGKNFYAIDENGAFCTSKDGRKWKVEKIIDDGYHYFKKLIWTGKILITYEKHKNIAYTCIPGEKWTEVKLPFSVQCIKSEGNKLYAFSNNPYSSSTFVAYSTDGFNWKTLDVRRSFEGIENIEYANENFYIQSANSSKVYLSKDGVKLKLVQNLDSLEDIATNKKLWLAISDNSLYQSTDGINFEHNDNFDFKYSLNAITTFRGGWCVVGDNGVIFTSKNGKEFFKVKSPTKNNLTSLYSDGKLLIAGGDNSTIIISKDAGITWSLTYNKLKGMNVTEIIKGNNVYLASLVGDTFLDYNNEFNTCLMSDDGVTWKKIGIPKYCKKIACFKGYFVAVGPCNNSMLSSDSVYWCSIDGEHWVNHYLEDSKQRLEEAVIGNDIMMMWNSYGDLFTTDGSGQNVQNNLTVNGTIKLPDGMVANKDGIELTMKADFSCVSIAARTCGKSIIKIKPGENSIEYTMPIKLTNAERYTLKKKSNNPALEIKVYIKDSMNLVTEFHFPVLKDVTSSDNTYNVELLSNVYTFRNKELEINFRDLLEMPSGIIKTDKLQTISAIVLKNFSVDMVEDLNNMTNLRQIIVPEEYAQQVATYLPYLDIYTYYYSDKIYRLYINNTSNGYYVIW